MKKMFKMITQSALLIADNIPLPNKLSIFAKR